MDKKGFDFLKKTVIESTPDTVGVRPGPNPDKDGSAFRREFVGLTLPADPGVYAAVLDGLGRAGLRATEGEENTPDLAEQVREDPYFEVKFIPGGLLLRDLNFKGYTEETTTTEAE